MKRIIFWGATGHARVLRELVGHLGYQVEALFDNNPQVNTPFHDVPLFRGNEGFDEWGRKREPGEVEFLVAIGGSRGRDKVQIHRFLKEKGLQPISVVHPTAFVASTARFAEGCQVLARAAVCADVEMGEECIVNTASSVDHESVLGKGVHIAPGATLAGCVTVGDFSLIGVGAVVLPRVKIGTDVIVGGGSVVTRDIPDGMVAFGNPARIRRTSAAPGA